MQPIRLLGIAGSLRSVSFNRALLRAAVEMAPPGVEITTFDELGALPFYDGDVEAAGDPLAVRSLRTAIEDAVTAGVARERLIVDPGIGFGKTPDHSIEILHRLAELKEALGALPLLVGTSRKRVIGELLGGAPPDQRVEGTAASVALAIAAGADIVRVHDVAAIMKTVRVSDGIVRWQP